MGVNNGIYEIFVRYIYIELILNKTHTYTYKKRYLHKKRRKGKNILLYLLRDLVIRLKFLQ